jgi:hypothetical protein
MNTKKIPLLLLCLAAIGIVVFFLTKNPSPTTQTTTDPTVIPTIAQIEITQAIIPLTNTPNPDSKNTIFKDYTHPTHGYAVKYPSDAKLSTQNTELTISKLGPTQRDQSELYDGILIKINVKTTEGKTLKEVAEARVEASKELGTILKPLEEVTINGKTGYTYRTRGLGEMTYTFLPFKDNQYLEVMDATHDPSKQGFVEIAKEIIDSIKY